MASNLPPGITENMIPGNRPEDLWCEEVLEGIDLPTGLMHLPAEFVSTTITMYLTRLDEACSEAFKAGHYEGRVDADLERSEQHG